MDPDASDGSSGGRGRDPVLEQAFDWILAIRDRPHDQGLRAARDAWIGESERHAHAYAEAEKVWSLTGRLDPADRHAGGPTRAAGRRNTVATRRSVIVAAAAAVVLFFAYPTLRLMISADHYTGVGEVRQMTMEDGSVIVLNADSAIAGRYTKAAREVVLLRGGAYFAVKEDASRPFVVRAAGLEARALGTAFAVQMTSAALSVAVETGKVRVDGGSRAQPIASDLTRGDRVVIDRDSGSAATGTIDTSEVAAWRHGRLFIEEARLSDVVEELGRYHSGTIVVASRALGSQRVTGVFDLHDTEGALRAAAAPFGGVVRKLTPYLLIVSAF